MLRLEPGDEMRFLFAADFAEADRGLHPVRVAVHGPCHCRDLGDIRIGHAIEQIVIADEPPQQPIEQGKAFGVAMQDRRPRQLNEFCRYVESAARYFKWHFNWRLERWGFMASHRPYRSGRVYV